MVTTLVTIHHWRYPTMPRTWRALPFAADPQVALKAPTWGEYQNQLDFGDHFRLPRRTVNELSIAQVLAEAIKSAPLPEGFKFTPGDTYTVQRYPTGFTVTMPSGWTLDVSTREGGKPDNLGRPAGKVTKLPTAPTAAKVAGARSSNDG